MPVRRPKIIVKNRNKILTLCILALIVVLSAALHFWRISYPAKPVFDEVHFATYAADYATHRAYFDIHPPLGKLVYAAVLSFVLPPNFSGNTQFVTTQINKKTNHLDTTDAGLPFGDFPYVPLRAVGAAVGIVLAVVFYKFLRTLGVGNVTSLLGAIFIVLENSLLVDTRLILLNGMYLALGLLALVLYFSPARIPPLSAWDGLPAGRQDCGVENINHESGRLWPVVAGAVWGLALSVKLIAVVFLGPIIVSYYLARARKDNYAPEKSAAGKFFVAGIVALILVSSFNLFFFSPSDRIGVLGTIGFNYKGPTISSAKTSALAFIGSSLAEMALSVSNYVEGPPNELQSSWYFWPAMQIPMPFYYEYAGSRLKEIVLQGNYVIWFAATFAVVLGIALLYRYLRAHLQRESGGDALRPFFILLGGYVGALLPYFTIVRRSTFLYHYFPALVFAVGLLVWFIGRALKLDDFDSLTRRQILWLALIVLMAFGGFLLTAPVTYGL